MTEHVHAHDAGVRDRERRSAPEWGGVVSSTPAKEARSRVGGMRDWPLAALLFGSAIVVYTVFGLGVYTALAAVL